MTVKYEPRIYAPLFGVPFSAQARSDVLYSYEHMRRSSARPFYMTVNLKPEVAVSLAEQSPYPDGVKLAVMKQLANEKLVTLTQLRIFLGWAARRSQHTGRL